MKSLVIALAILFGVLQYKLWFEKDGVAEIAHLQSLIAQQTKENQELTQKNTALMAEVNDLKNGQAEVEEHARNDLGMIKPGETFYQIVGPQNK